MGLDALVLYLQPYENRITKNEVIANLSSKRGMPRLHKVLASALTQKRTIWTLIYLAGHTLCPLGSIYWLFFGPKVDGEKRKDTRAFGRGWKRDISRAYLRNPFAVCSTPTASEQARICVTVTPKNLINVTYPGQTWIAHSSVNFNFYNLRKRNVLAASSSFL